MAKLKELKWKRTFILSTFALLLLFSLYHAYYANKIIPGINVGNSALGGKTPQEAALLLQEPLEKEYTISLEDAEKDKIYEFKTSDISLEYDIENTIEVAFNVGRNANFFSDLVIKVTGLITNHRIGAVSDYDTALLEQELSKIKGLVDKPPQNAKFYLDEDEFLRIQPEQQGRKVGANKLYQKVLHSIENIEYSQKQLPISIESADILAIDLEKMESEIRPLIRDDLTVKHGENAWKVSPAEKLAYIEVVKEENELDLGLNFKVFNSYVERLGKDVNTLPRGKVTEETEDGQVLEFELVEEGEELDTETFTNDFKVALLNNKDEVVITTIPTDNTSDLTKYGIFALLGRGESDYTGSIPSRAHNLTLAAERASGVLVPSGEIFSLNQAVGKINAATGYNSAWIISNGRTVLGAGGGVCQTSTTMFRAALNSGLPVVERHAHAYRVSYYERDEPLGFDAAIYQPALDLKFKNDTPNYVMVQTETIPEENKLAFRIYGTPDGREVEISEPEIFGVSPAPTPLYEETDELPEGTVKQVDFAAPGGTSVFSRTVKKDGEVLFEENYRSVYRPWRAIFLVGTGSN